MLQPLKPGAHQILPGASQCSIPRPLTCTKRLKSIFRANSKSNVDLTTRATPSSSLFVASVVAHASPPPLHPIVSGAVLASCGFAITLFSLMISHPRSTRLYDFIRSYWLLSPVAVLYVGLLVNSYTPDMASVLMPGSLEAGLSGGFNPQFFPKLEGMQELFSRPATVASWIVHMLGINLFVGRSIYLNGFITGLPTRHSLLLTALVGPLGLIMHWATQALHALFPHLQDPSPIVYETSNGGSITLLPYDTPGSALQP